MCNRTLIAKHQCIRTRTTYSVCQKEAFGHNINYKSPRRLPFTSLLRNFSYTTAFGSTLLVPTNEQTKDPPNPQPLTDERPEALTKSDSHLLWPLWLVVQLFVTIVCLFITPGWVRCISNDFLHFATQLSWIRINGVLQVIYQGTGFKLTAGHGSSIDVHGVCKIHPHCPSLHN